MRDMRDPATLGHLYLAARGRGESIDSAVKIPAPEDHGDQDVIARYGSCNDVEEKFMVVQVR